MELRVMFEGREVGRLRYGSGVSHFAYSRDWLNHGFPISPRSLPLEDRLFSGRPDVFAGLHGVFADSLPGGWDANDFMLKMMEKVVSLSIQRLSPIRIPVQPTQILLKRSSGIRSSAICSASRNSS